jgi:hypothetical protein
MLNADGDDSTTFGQRKSTRDCLYNGTIAFLSRQSQRIEQSVLPGIAIKSNFGSG